VAFLLLTWWREAHANRLAELQPEGVQLEFPSKSDSWNFPPELEQYWDVASDVDRYLEWKQSTNMGQLRPRWDERERTLWLGKQQVKRLRDKANNQESILDAFEAVGWPIVSIKNPLRDRELLRQTVKDFNNSLDGNIPFQLLQDGDRVAWLAESRGDTSRNSR
jgi:hypothetical protein